MGYSYFDQFLPGLWGSTVVLWALPWMSLVWVTTKFFGEYSRVSVIVDEFHLVSLSMLEGLGFEGVRKAGSIHALVCLFSVLVCVNYLGLVPFVYPVSSHPCGVIFLVILFWGAGSLPMLGNLGAFISTFSVGGVGIGFKILVTASEILSWAVRPIILGVRLMVNVFCGHLLMAVLAHLGCAMVWGGSVMGGFVSLVGLMGFLAMESLVLGIQAYVFTLIVVYSWSEGFYPLWFKL